MGRRRLGVIVTLPEPLAIHVQAWRRALRDPTAERVGPHLTLVPPQAVADQDVPAAQALVERAAAEAVPCVVELDGAATFLPASPVAFLVVTAGGAALEALEVALRAPPLDRRTHPFHPHVTVTQDRPAAEVAAAARELAGFRAFFPVREVALMQEGRDRVWRPLAELPVGASPLVREAPFAQAAAAALFLVQPDPPRVLLGHRTGGRGRRYPGAWDAIGGKPEPGESLLAALAREAREEAGVEPLDVTAIGCFDDGDRADAFYLATAWTGEPGNRDPAEHSELAWVPLPEAGERPMAPTTREALARLATLLGSPAWLHPRR
jgi:8-oxo-dGTP pyrophosphatase MutT (NUDIX family)/2'-5' RNA ligase